MSQLLNGSNTEQQEEDKSTKPAGKEIFTPGQFQKAMDKYIGLLANAQEKMFFSKPRVLNGTSMELQVANEYEDKGVRDVLPNLISFLRTELNNSDIHVYTSIVAPEPEEQSNPKPYTDAEKLQYMMEQHPILHRLVDTLKLDIG